MEHKKVEIWYQENYDLLKGEFEQEYYHKSFETETEALNYVQEKLLEELQEFKKLAPDLTCEELLSRYRMFGTDYYLKNVKVGFSSWGYVEENLGSFGLC